MTPKDFIITQIERIAKEFSFLKYDYYQDEPSDSHFVQISPNEYFESYEEKFTLLQNEVVLEFIEKYPFESFAFIGDQELFEGEEPVYSLAGTSYFESVELCWSGVQVEELFNNYKPEFKKGRYSFQSSASVDQTEVMTGFNINLTGKSKSNQGAQGLNSNIDKTAINDSVIYSEFGDDDYLLAA